MASAASARVAERDAPAAAADDECLLSVEVVVGAVADLDVACRIPAVAFRLLDYPTVVVHHVNPSDTDKLRRAAYMDNDAGIDRALEKLRDADGGFLFNTGKSCLFRASLSGFAAQMQKTPLYIMLVDLWEADNVRLVASTSLRLDGCAGKIVADADSHGRDAPSSALTKGAFPLFDLMGVEVGVISFTVRLMNLGAAMLKHVANASPENGAMSVPSDGMFHMAGEYGPSGDGDSDAHEGHDDSHSQSDQRKGVIGRPQQQHQHQHRHEGDLPGLRVSRDSARVSHAPSSQAARLGITDEAEPPHTHGAVASSGGRMDAPVAVFRDEEGGDAGFVPGGILIDGRERGSRAAAVDGCGGGRNDVDSTSLPSSEFPADTLLRNVYCPPALQFDAAWSRDYVPPEAQSRDQYGLFEAGFPKDAIYGPSDPPLPPQVAIKRTAVGYDPQMPFPGAAPSFPAYNGFGGFLNGLWLDMQYVRTPEYAREILRGFWDDRISLQAPTQDAPLSRMSRGQPANEPKGTAGHAASSGIPRRLAAHFGALFGGRPLSPRQQPMVSPARRPTSQQLSGQKRPGGQGGARPASAASAATSAPSRAVSRASARDGVPSSKQPNIPVRLTRSERLRQYHVLTRMTDAELEIEAGLLPGELYHAHHKYSTAEQAVLAKFGRSLSPSVSPKMVRRSPAPPKQAPASKRTVADVRNGVDTSETALIRDAQPSPSEKSGAASSASSPSGVLPPGAINARYAMPSTEPAMHWDPSGRAGFRKDAGVDFGEHPADAAPHVTQGKENASPTNRGAVSRPRVAQTPVRTSGLASAASKARARELEANGTSIPQTKGKSAIGAAFVRRAQPAHRSPTGSPGNGSDHVADSQASDDDASAKSTPHPQRSEKTATDSRSQSMDSRASDEPTRSRSSRQSHSSRSGTSRASGMSSPGDAAQQRSHSSASSVIDESLASVSHSTDSSKSHARTAEVTESEMAGDESVVTGRTLTQSADRSRASSTVGSRGEQSLSVSDMSDIS